MADSVFTLLGISGSLRIASSNTALLRAAGQLAPDKVALSLYAGMADLPAFNPDIPDQAAPPSVTAFRKQIVAVNGIVISSPEYAHGVPGSLKNALDWVVGSGEFVDKPVVLFSARRAAYAHASLLETLTVMSAKVVHDACLTLGLTSNRMDEHTILADAELSNSLRTAMASFVRGLSG